MLPGPGLLVPGGAGTGNSHQSLAGGLPKAEGVRHSSSTRPKPPMRLIASPCQTLEQGPEPSCRLPRQGGNDGDGCYASAPWLPSRNLALYQHGANAASTSAIRRERFESSAATRVDDERPLVRVQPPLLENRRLDRRLAQPHLLGILKQVDVDVVGRVAEQALAPPRAPPPADHRRRSCRIPVKRRPPQTACPVRDRVRQRDQVQTRDRASRRSTDRRCSPHRSASGSPTAALASPTDGADVLETARQSRCQCRRNRARRDMCRIRFQRPGSR